MKRELQRLEELKKLNGAKAKLKVYDGAEFYPDQEHAPQNFILPTAIPESNQVNSVPLYSQPLRDMAPRPTLQDD